MNVLHNPILSGHNAEWDTPSEARPQTKLRNRELTPMHAN